ncbi:hypothetical protein CCR94_08300 [Rhodoblastus sphagnicola]|uniref:Glycosyltransferase 2-like domain-containing protein n=1 Tax=Rhodoblastus sphagnicola TaxID=333368 RepID=A0A2S6NAP5_9HYPH|nr:glycosyltransferase [Rhodoblastus sphagnicola]MBB4200278.1 glycosyltransferase involved in cell wall biosynthesis [Rhodoblastus sphagnicola]PPQ31664.1 hypothetical protein CCR94_08300 [Rhodoblastus sphagnicola]
MIETKRPESPTQKPLVSILMLAYRHEAYIAQAIEGVLAQSCDFPIELIIAEDCSPDATRAIAEIYQCRHPEVIRIVTGDENIGVMRNFYRALAQCRGAYVAFCEGDDYWCNPTKLAKQIAMMEVDAGLGMTHGNYVTARPSQTGWVVGGRGAHDGRGSDELSGDMFSLSLRELAPRTCTMVVRRVVLDDLGDSVLGNPDYVAGDLPITVFCAANWRIGYLDEVVAVYRLSPNSATRNSFQSKLRFFEGLVKIRDDIEATFGHRADFDRSSAAWVHDTHAQIAFRANDPAAFAQAMRRLREIDPRSAGRFGLRLRQVLLAHQRLTLASNKLIDFARSVQTTFRS